MHDRSWKAADTEPIVQQLLSTDSLQQLGNPPALTSLCLTATNAVGADGKPALNTGSISDFLVNNHNHISGDLLPPAHLGPGTALPTTQVLVPCTAKATLCSHTIFAAIYQPQLRNERYLGAVFIDLFCSL